MIEGDGMENSNIDARRLEKANIKEKKKCKSHTLSKYYPNASLSQNKVK